MASRLNKENTITATIYLPTVLWEIDLDLIAAFGALYAEMGIAKKAVDSRVDRNWLITGVRFHADLPEMWTSEACAEFVQIADWLEANF